MRSCPSGLAAGAVLLALALAGSAQAAPVTVQLRIEGADRTLYEGPVTTDVRPFAFTSGDMTAHTCDGSPPAGAASSPQVTRGAVVAAAGVATTGSWSSAFGSPAFTTIAGESVAFDSATNRYLVEYKNGVSAQTGACGDLVAAGDQVLFAYGTGTEPLLTLAGPVTLSAGQAARYTVTDTTGPVAGAAVAGQLTDASGHVSLTLPPGTTALKATKPGEVRSNALSVAVSAAAAPAPAPAPARDTTPPAARLGKGIADGQVFKHGKGPRTLRATVPGDPSGLAVVKLRLSRRHGSHCAAWSGRRERFLGVRCAKPFPFSVAANATVSYLLPKRLGRGRYQLEVIAVDRAGNRTTPHRGTTRAGFKVR